VFLIVAFLVSQIFGIVGFQILFYFSLASIFINVDAKLEELEGCFDKDEIKDM
jgi:hypothetical protein